MKKIFVPRDIIGFYLFAKAFLGTLAKKLVKIGFDQAFYNDRLRTGFLQFETALQKCEDPLTRTKADLIARDETREVFEPDLHLAIGMVRTSPNATKADQEELGIFIEKHSTKVLPPPHDSPSWILLPSTNGYVKVRVLNAETGKIGKPKGASGWFLVYEISDTIPADESGYTNHEYISGTTFSKKFIKSLRGKKMQACLYWVNTVGDQSPWTINIEIVIP
jgi:hypothetical protein